MLFIKQLKKIIDFIMKKFDIFMLFYEGKDKLILKLCIKMSYIKEIYDIYKVKIRMLIVLSC